MQVPFSGILRNYIQDDDISASKHLLYVRDEVKILWKALEGLEDATLLLKALLGVAKA